MAKRPAYIHGSTARKLQQEELAPRRGIQVMPGGGREERTASSLAIVFARVLVALIVAFAAIGWVRISLASATVSVALEASQLKDDISDARDVGSQLEVTQSSLANPTRVKRDALALGMRSPASASFIDISGDVVVRDEDGRLSLSGTVEAVAEAEGLTAVNADADVSADGAAQAAE